jgi:MFS family permease
MALFRSPTVSWLGDLFLPDDRSKANGIINLMGGIGSLIAFLGGGFLFNNFGRAAPFIAGAVLMVAALSVALFGVRESREAAEVSAEAGSSVRASLRAVVGHADRSGLYVLIGILFWFIAFNALEAGLSSFAVFTLGIAPGTASIYAAAISLSFLVFAWPAGIAGTRYGRRGVILVGLTGLTILFAAAYFIIQGAATFILVLVLGGLFWAMVNVNSLPLVYDYGDERQIGAYTGLYYFSSQLAAVLGPTLGGVLVDVLGNQYRWLFLFSAVFMALAWLVVTRIRPRAVAVAI